MTVDDDFLSGHSGQVTGIRATTLAIVADALADLALFATLRRSRLQRAVESAPSRSVLAVGIERTETPNLLAAAREELLRSRHAVEFVRGTAGQRGKFENLRQLLAEHPAAGHDWLLAVDDDVALPVGFLDAFLFLAERFDLRLAQPAHRHRSHAAWPVTRRRVRSVVRETAFVEIGPVVAFHASTFDQLLPFPPLRMGWGLDAHWSAVALRNGWRLGIVDATPVLHGMRPVAASYDRSDAVLEARAFLADRPYVKTEQALKTLVAHRSWR